jgi:hypothetical protein
VKAGTGSNASNVVINNSLGTGTDTFNGFTPGSVDVGSPLTAIVSLKLNF